MSSHTTVPAPKLLAWCADPSNPVGAEYIIMEKAPGIQLFKVWDDIKEFDRLKLIKSLTQLENQFAVTRFPAYGSLYFRHSISKASERIFLDPSVDPTGSFCVGLHAVQHGQMVYPQMISNPTSTQAPVTKVAPLRAPY